jgi:hypothetical protein
MLPNCRFIIMSAFLAVCQAFSGPPMLSKYTTGTKTCPGLAHRQGAWTSPYRHQALPISFGNRKSKKTGTFKTFMTYLAEDRVPIWEAAETRTLGRRHAMYGGCIIHGIMCSLMLYYFSVVVADAMTVDGTTYTASLCLCGSCHVLPVKCLLLNVQRTSKRST